MLNDLTLIGRLTKTPENRGTENNVCVFTLAVNRNYMNQQGEREADFIQIKTFKKLAENCSKYLKKGHLVAVKGHIKTGSYQKDGKTQFTMDIIGDDVRFLEGKKNSGQNNQSSNNENNTQNRFNQNDEDPFANSGSMSDEPWPFS